MALFHLRADKGIRALALGGEQPARLDLLAARRHLVNDRKVEVAVECERECARDGRGRHYQHVRISPGLSLLPKRRALLHAKAMLLVNHQKSQIAEGDIG